MAPHRSRKALQSHCLKGSSQRAFTALEAYLGRLFGDHAAFWKFLSHSIPEFMAYGPADGTHLHQDLWDSDQEEWEVQKA